MGYEANKKGLWNVLRKKKNGPLRTAGWLVVYLGDCLYVCSKLNDGANVCSSASSLPFPHPTMSGAQWVKFFPLKHGPVSP